MEMWNISTNFKGFGEAKFQVSRLGANTLVVGHHYAAFLLGSCHITATIRHWSDWNRTR